MILFAVFSIILNFAILMISLCQFRIYLVTMLVTSNLEVIM